MNIQSFGKLALATLLATASVACGGQAAPPAMTAAAVGCHQIQDPLAASAPFYDPGNAYSHRPIEQNYSRQNWNGKLLGAEVYVMATPGTTREYLQRALSCHATGAGPAASPNDPLRPSGGIAEVRVRSIGHGFGVAIFGTDKSSSNDVLQRARAMTSGVGASVDVKQVGSVSGAIGMNDM